MTAAGAAALRHPLRALNASMAACTLRMAARRIADHQLEIRAEGVEHVPAHGPVLLAARHYHHLYDGVVLLGVVPRPLHILVALDWVGGRPLRAVMEWATRTARWPVVLRQDELGAGAAAPRRRAFAPDETARARRRGAADCVALLREGAALVVFPEGYPNIDPRYTPKRDQCEFLPFRAGFTTVVALAERRLGVRVPIVPTGLAYTRGERWQVTARFGRPMYLERGARRRAFIAAVQRRVEELSS